MQKKKKITRATWFFTGEVKEKLCLKNVRDSIKSIITLAKIYSARETSHNLTSMNNS